jgi:GH24 family phage-related lysozyme (muramidase)
MSYNDLKARIKEHEGFVPKIYKDSLGFATIGYGHLVLETDRFKEGVTYKKKDLEEVFDSDFNTAKSNANQLIEGLPIHHQAKCVIIEMVFQLGIGGVSKFKKMWKALKQNDYQIASEEMLDSKWAKQTPKRAEELSSVMKSCKI